MMEWLLTAVAQVVIVGPSISFPEPPRLVVVSPGIRVVHDYDQEVFFVGGYYWMRNGDVWYRTNHHRGRWIAVERVHVPRALVRIKPGKYRRYRGEVRVEHRTHKKHKRKHKRH